MGSIPKASGKVAKTYSLDRSLLEELKRSKGARSESERVNTLLRYALELEKRAALHHEAASFFCESQADRAERDGFEAATTASWARD